MTLLPSQRALFDIPDEVVYLNCAYMSPFLKTVAAAGDLGIKSKLHPWHIMPQDYFTLSEQVRVRFAELIHARADDIALVPSASYGIAVAANNLPVSAAQSIVLLADEFPSNYYSWKALAERTGAVIHTVARPVDGDWTQALLAALDERAAIVSVPHCHWTDGGLIDLPRLSARCRDLGAALVIDGTQSIGALPLSVTDVDADFIVTAGYKWMMGPYTYSYLYVAPRRQDGRPIEENWINRRQSENFARLVDYQEGYQPGARRFDVGERNNFALAPAALAAIDQLLAWGVANTAATLERMTGLIAERATAMGMRCADHNLRAPHMIGLQADHLPDDLLPRLSKQNIYVSRRGNALRISPHLYNTESDIDRFFMALEMVCAG